MPEYHIHTRLKVHMESETPPTPPTKKAVIEWIPIGTPTKEETTPPSPASTETPPATDPSLRQRERTHPETKLVGVPLRPGTNPETQRATAAQIRDRKSSTPNIDTSNEVTQRNRAVQGLDLNNLPNRSPEDTQPAKQTDRFIPLKIPSAEAADSYTASMTPEERFQWLKDHEPPQTDEATIRNKPVSRDELNTLSTIREKFFSTTDKLLQESQRFLNENQYVSAFLDAVERQDPVAKATIISAVELVLLPIRPVLPLSPGDILGVVNGITEYRKDAKRGALMIAAAIIPLVPTGIAQEFIRRFIPSTTNSQKINP